MFVLQMSLKGVTLPYFFVRVVEGCTLTAHREHGIKYCSVEMIKCDLVERKVNFRRMTNEQMRNTLEKILREEEEYEHLIMYRRDKRFYDTDTEYNHKLQLDRTILDMLHCPMRMHEKILNLLYGYILNGKTKNEVNATRQLKVYVPPLGVSAVGERIGKEFENDDGEVELFMGTVRAFIPDAGTGLYAVHYEDGDQEDMDCEQYSQAHELGQALTYIGDKEKNVDKKFKATLRPALEELTIVIRDLGSLGPTWTHQWSETKTKSLKKIALPLDQSKKIFRVCQLEGLKKAVYIAIPDSKPYLREQWVAFLTEYVHAIEILTKSAEYVPGEIDILEGYMDRAYRKLLDIAGIEGLTNYFHYFGSGHIIWLTRKYGNLWRFRNEGVESMNGVLSLRYNKFNNRGGNKGSHLDGINEKCDAFEVLGSWMARLSMWQLGLGDAIFRIPEHEENKVVRWRTRFRIMYEPQARDLPRTTTIIEDLDRWIAEEEALWLMDGDGGV